MKTENRKMEVLMSFLVCTACITILEGILGMIFMPEVRFGYEAFFSPPVFGFFSALSGAVLDTGKERSVRQVWVRRGIHLILIEALVFGANYAAGMEFETVLAGTLAAAIAVVFLIVYLILWMNDAKSAAEFNERLKNFQQGVHE